MPSIRLTLLVYFLSLMTVGLGVASMLVYDTARNNLLEKEEAARTLIQARFEERSKERLALVDARLLDQAKSLTRRVDPRTRWDMLGLVLPGPRGTPRGPYHLAALTCLFTAQAGPNAHVTIPGWVFQGQQAYIFRPGGRKGSKAGKWYILTRAQWYLWQHDSIHLRLPPLPKGTVLPDEGEAGRTVFRIQTNGWGPSIPRPLKKDSSGPMLPDESAFAPDKRLDWSFDVYKQPGQVALRRVRLRAQINQSVPPYMPDRSHPLPAVIVQCAVDTGPLERAMADLSEQRDSRLSQLKTETETALTEQRNRLLAIILITFAATVLGSFALVRLGLRPLRRLTEAVRQVSPRDFRLPIQERGLPRELRPIAGRLVETLDALKRAFAREKQATADISHELRTPLAALLTTLDLALRKPRTAEQYRELMQDCRNSTQQMHQIVERLLTLARVDAGVDRFKAQPVDVGQLASQCAALVRPLADARGLTLAVHVPSKDQNGRIKDESEDYFLDSPSSFLPPPCEVTTDPDKLREVVTNLLHNAIQYNSEGGAVDLTVARENGHLEVAVRDSGIGISPEALSHIFERFYRADPSRNSDDLHAGLGLSIVKEYVDLMGGQIEVESTVGLGSTFRVCLPVGDRVRGEPARSR